tara:strand:- start:750 stop:953 length:204 start_codon:yes stop_codon:yes gene_type:complete
MNIELYKLHQNQKGEWGMYREYHRGGTAVYWSKANPEQIRYLEGFSTKRKQEKYIEEQNKLLKRIFK